MRQLGGKVFEKGTENTHFFATEVQRYRVPSQVSMCPQAQLTLDLSFDLLSRSTGKSDANIQQKAFHSDSFQFRE